MTSAVSRSSLGLVAPTVALPLTLALGLLVAFVPGARPACAQDVPAASAVVVDPAAGPAPSLDETMAESAEGSDARTGAGITPLVAPVPFKNTQIGWGLAMMLGAIHRFDPDTTLKPSTGVVGGFYTENKSWGLMAMEMARFQQDTWRLRGVFAHIDVRYDFYGIGEEAGEAGLSVPLEQTIDMGYLSVVRRFAPGLYAGPTVMAMHTEVALRHEPVPGFDPPSEDARAADLVAPGLQGEFDSRDDDYWPTHGSFATVKANIFTESLGSSRTFQRYSGAWSWYGRLPEPKTVVATNLYAAGAAGDAPFYALPSIGAGRYPLRGYTQGRYRDRVMLSAQGELRRPLTGRFGGAAFAGFGLVAPSGADVFDARLMPAGGIGARFRLTRRFPLNMRLDIAWGRDEPLFYFGVGEAF